VFHWKRGADPAFPALFLQRPVHGGKPLARVELPGLTIERVSAADPARRAALRAAVVAVGDRFYAGFDASSEIDHLIGRGLGEVWVASLAGRPVGFATGHFGPGSEAFADGDLAFRFLVVEPGLAEGERVFLALVQAGEDLAREAGLETVGGVASGGRRATVATMFDRGYRPLAVFTEFPFVHDAPPLWTGRRDLDTSHPEQFVLIELR
jgi:hypothetical protein